jgi:hypothetical protein
LRAAAQDISAWQRMWDHQNCDDKTGDLRGTCASLLELGADVAADVQIIFGGLRDWVLESEETERITARAQEAVVRYDEWVVLGCASQLSSDCRTQTDAAVRALKTLSMDATIYLRASGKEE